MSDDEQDYADDFESEESPQKKAPAAVATDSKGVDESKHEDATPKWEEINMKDVVIGQQIGGGGFAIVFAAKWRGRDVAAKQLVSPDAEAQADFMSELHTMAAIPQHPNIVYLLGACVLPPKPCFIMPLCGISLHQALHMTPGRKPALPLLLAWAVDAASAIAHLHAQRPAVIHRDIKSLNVLLSADGNRALLTDFGLVHCRLTAAGTPQYMSPELLASKPFNKSVDVYALGILLWEMFSGVQPYAGWRVGDIKSHVVGGGRPEIAKLRSDLPPPVLAAIQQLAEACWAPEAAARPDAASVLATLQKLRASAGGGSSSSSGGAGGSGSGGSSSRPGSGRAAVPEDSLASIMASTGPAARKK